MGNLALEISEACDPPDAIAVIHLARSPHLQQPVVLLMIAPFLLHVDANLAAKAITKLKIKRLENKARRTLAPPASSSCKAELA